MNDPITTEIQNIINQQLPAQVGEVLKRRLAEVEVLERELSECKTLISTLRGRVSKLEQEASVILNLEDREKAVSKGAAALEKERQELAIQKAVLLSNDKMIKDMLDRNERIVLAVFANNRFKYQEHVGTSRTELHQTSPGCYPQQIPVTDSKNRTVEGEG